MAVISLRGITCCLASRDKKQAFVRAFIGFRLPCSRPAPLSLGLLRSLSLSVSLLVARSLLNAGRPVSAPCSPAQGGTFRASLPHLRQDIKSNLTFKEAIISFWWWPLHCAGRTHGQNGRLCGLSSKCHRLEQSQGTSLFSLLHREKRARFMKLWSDYIYNPERV